MSPRKPKNVVAVTPGGDITLDHIIGFYAMFTVPDQPVSASKLQRLWAGHGLPPGMVPTSRRTVNGFQVACRSVETRRKDGANHQEEIKVDEVLEDYDTCVYQITRMVRDKANREIEHPKAMRITFDKHAQAVSWEILDGGANAARLESIGDAILAHYEANAKKVPGARVRAAIRSLMRECGAQNVRRKAGGVYFVPKDGKAYLDGLTEVLDGLWGDDAELHLIFAANAEGERELIERHFTANVSSEVDEVLAEVTGSLTSSRKMRSDRLNNILAQRKTLGEHRERYADLLNEDLSTVNEKLDLLDAGLEELITGIGED